MAKKKIEIIPMGKSPIEDGLHWLILHERMVKEIALIFRVPVELLEPSRNLVCGQPAPRGQDEPKAEDSDQ